ncbi:hypothetical protein RB594_003694 [Gaeumannomyces avenae]
MGVVGATLIFGAVVYFVIRPPHAFLFYFQSIWRGIFLTPRLADNVPTGDDDDGCGKQQAAVAPPTSQPVGDAAPAAPAAPAPAIRVPSPSEDDTNDADEQQTTPKATKASPSFSLSGPNDDDQDNDNDFPLITPHPPTPPSLSMPVPEPSLPQPPSPMAPPPRPGPMAPPPRLGSSSSSSASSSGRGLMAPPSGPPRLPPLSQQQSPYAQSQLSRSTLPIPSRGGGAPSSSSLAPPPTHTGKPAPRVPPAQNARSRLVPLAPGHSPLDWARLSSGPAADLRGLPLGTPYLRVSPSMLKRRDGRKGRDAWSAYGGRVYNVSPYVPFHPGGKGELLRGAGKDATRLFGEVHPWVNYETMLAACLVGILVDEGEGHEDEKSEQKDGGGASNMEDMD